MRLLRDLTIRQKLTSISMLSGITALVCASIAFLAYDAHSFRASMARRILTDAQIIAFNSISPLLFDDAEAATATVGGLKAETAVRAAVLFRQRDGRRFAAYGRDAASAGATLAAPADAAELTFTSDHLIVTEPIRFEGQVLGSLVIQADLAEIRERRQRYAAIVGVVLAVSFVLALAISRPMATAIERPIVSLADAARAVSQQKDFSVRARADGSDEIASLVVTFNEMLDQIQRQNAELEQGRLELEARVEMRTRDLAAANKELEAFSYSVSHDLRAPLRAIDGFSKALIAGHASALDEKGRHYLERVRAATQRMSELIDDLLGLARVSRRELVRQYVDMSDLACRVAAELARQQPERQVRVDVEPGISVQADPHLLTIVFENLLGNAWKFTGKRDDARIEIGRQAVAKELVFFIRDNGAGFDMAYADKLFGAFQRLHDPEQFEGTGIGLVTVQRIVNRHGGRIWAQGELGKGATFSFTLERNP
jgi:signal transduction histidine kinase